MSRIVSASHFLLTASLFFHFTAAAPAQGTLYTFHGDIAFDALGSSVGGAGDVNGDGFDDLIAGIPGDDSFGNESGAARVYSGVDGTILYSFFGGATFHMLGTAVDGAGDVNNDGYTDLITGSPLTHAKGTNCGSATVFSGLNGGILHQFHGDSAHDTLGVSVSGAGDVDGDGFADVIAGATGDDDNGSQCGSARVYSGKTGTILYTFFGDSASDKLGTSVSGAGDVDHDGLADLIAGADGDDDFGTDCGSARVYAGHNGAILHTFFGDKAGDRMGSTVSDAGNIDLDSFDDLVVAAYSDDMSGVDRGCAWVFSGKDGKVLFALEGEADNLRLGDSVSGTGDVDGDGYVDLLAGVTRDATNGTNAGSARVYSGKDGSIVRAPLGDSAGDLLGCAVSGAGDVNADGFADFFAGAYGDDDNGASSGSARVFSTDCGSMISYGAGCAGSGGFVPTLTGTPACGAVPGHQIDIRIGDGLGGASTLIFFGLNQTSLPMGSGCSLNVSPLLKPIIAVPLGGTGPGNGKLTLSAVVPAILSGFSFTMQSFIIDPGGASGFSNSNGLEVSVH